VPALVRWPWLVPPQREINDRLGGGLGADLMARRASDIKNKLLQGYTAATRASRCT